jgi:hypothetical protein
MVFYKHPMAAKDLAMIRPLSSMPLRRRPPIEAAADAHPGVPRPTFDEDEKLRISVEEVHAESTPKFAAGAGRG